MSELIYERIKDSLTTLKMTNTLEIMDNYLEHAMKENTPVLDILDHIFAREAESRRLKAVNTNIQMAGFPYRKTLDDFDFDFKLLLQK